jgi:hypothetical protein
MSDLWGGDFMRTLLGALLSLTLSMSAASAVTMPDPSFTVLTLDVASQFVLSPGQTAGFQFTGDQGSIVVGPASNIMSPITVEFFGFDPITQALVYDSGAMTFPSSVGGLNVPFDALWNMTLTTSTTQAFFVDRFDVTPTPLPAALPLFAAGLGALAVFGWRRKRRGAASFAAA